MSRIELLGVNQDRSKRISRQRTNINFAANEEKPQVEKEPQKHSHVKTITNVGGVILGLGAVSALVISKQLRPKNVKLLEKQKDKLKKVQDGLDNLVDKVTVDKTKMNKSFKFGLWSNKIADHNPELFNNLIYGFGTVAIMPLVILFAPFGKNKSTPEDRLFTVLRQPISFVTMFGMQLTVDKFIKDLVPKFVKNNSLEKDIEDSKGNKIYDNIQFNTAEYKTHFSDQLKKVGGMSAESVSGLLKINDEQSIKKEILKLPKEKIVELLPKLDKYFKIKGREQLLGQTIVVIGNVLFSAPIGCTMLNVFYGKSMKALKPPKVEAKAKENNEKGGQV